MNKKEIKYLYKNSKGFSIDDIKLKDFELNQVFLLKIKGKSEKEISLDIKFVKYPQSNEKIKMYGFTFSDFQDSFYFENTTIAKEELRKKINELFEQDKKQIVKKVNKIKKNDFQVNIGNLSSKNIEKFDIENYMSQVTKILIGKITYSSLDHTRPSILLKYGRKKLNSMNNDLIFKQVNVLIEIFQNQIKKIPENERFSYMSILSDKIDEIFQHCIKYKIGDEPENEIDIYFSTLGNQDTFKKYKKLFYGLGILKEDVTDISIDDLFDDVISGISRLRRIIKKENEKTSIFRKIYKFFT